MSRSRLTHALVVSLLLHAVVALIFFLRGPSAAPKRLKDAPGELQWVEVVAPPKPAEQPKVVEPPKPVAANAQKVASAQPSLAPPATPEAKSDQPTSDAKPTAEANPAAPRVVSLIPSVNLSTSGGGDFAVEVHGQTLHPDDAQFQPETIRAEAVKTVKARVTGMYEDEIAIAKAQNGLPHPYFMGLRSTLKTTLDFRAREEKMVVTGAEVMASIGRRYLDASEAYGKGGNPNLGAPGTSQRPSEKLAGASNASNIMPLRMLAQAQETQDDLSNGKPFLMLQLELRQFKDGTAPAITLVQRSNDPKFDAFVVAEWPKTIVAAGPPPDDAFRGPMLRSVWQIEGWARLPKQMQEAMAYAPGIMGLGVDKIGSAVGAVQYHYEFDAKLLRAY